MHLGTEKAEKELYIVSGGGGGADYGIANRLVGTTAQVFHTTLNARVMLASETRFRCV